MLRKILLLLIQTLMLDFTLKMTKKKLKNWLSLGQKSIELSLIILTAFKIKNFSMLFIFSIVISMVCLLFLLWLNLQL